MGQLVLLRHGQSVYNAENRFTGWVDVPLTALGRAEAVAAGAALRAAGIVPTRVHTSLLGRAITTTHLALEAAGCLWADVTRSWRLNERHYGALAGLDKEQMLAATSPQQVQAWRRSWAARPPALEDLSEFLLDPRYAHLDRDELPATESLADVSARVLPYWERFLVPDLRAGHTVLVGSHGNTLRALVKHLESISDANVEFLEIATGAPRVYECTHAAGDIEFSPAQLLAPAGGPLATHSCALSGH